MAPTKYKRSMIINLVHRVFNATSTWENFANGMNTARKILDYNMYPTYWYEPIIHKTLEKIYTGEKKNEPEKDELKSWCS